MRRVRDDLHVFYVYCFGFQESLLFSQNDSRRIEMMLFEKGLFDFFPFSPEFKEKFPASVVITNEKAPKIKGMLRTSSVDGVRPSGSRLDSKAGRFHHRHLGLPAEGYRK